MLTKFSILLLRFDWILNTGIRLLCSIKTPAHTATEPTETFDNPTFTFVKLHTVVVYYASK